MKKDKIVNIYDFDGTIYDGDSTIDFYLYCLKKDFLIIRFLPIQFYYLILYKLKIKPKKEFKEKFFVFLKSINNLDYCINNFWDKNMNKIKDFYYDLRTSNDVIISASPYFLIKEIGKRLNVLDVIATNITNKGKIVGKNCYGEEKVLLFKKKYKDYKVDKVYTDSLSDLPIMNLGKSSYIVKKNKIIKYGG